MKGGYGLEDTMIFDLSSDDEEIVKSYECTGIRKLFFGQAKGYITLTNRRILYHATGKSLKGKSLILNEMPIDDVSGMRTYMGASIDWISLIIFILVSYFVVTPFILGVLPTFASGLVFGLICIIPYAVIFLWQKDFFSKELKDRVIVNLQGMNLGEHTHKILIGLSNEIVSILFVLGVYIVAMNLFSGELRVLRVIFFIIVYFKIIGSIRVFSLQLYSKSTKGTGIFLPGVQKLQIFNFRTNDTTALDTVTGVPAMDSELLIREIGAIITDLKEMGDLAISKWK